YVLSLRLIGKHDRIRTAPKILLLPKTNTNWHRLKLKYKLVASLYMTGEVSKKPMKSSTL
ncbi:MAG: hypothetical protein QM751_07485, partial [Paludibacteraceae bacterium]